ncbi:aldo/keto reductase [Luteimicrobium subarcticum]|uniref:Aryl-alcohol dehydrogenase-like predicted oxidoreductase n=1 Tax=Luteimicrobium subarcticum TaxID=620910 RepID=A0A2M8WW20_9MICO|nr:aldo/keto reductase [Luteimicrobium subarcticum]PJI95116.1 aryl-alcohol dehydrogenase-like predicted oxidoreductase [Luteimicrobium subarcticum]
MTTLDLGPLVLGGNAFGWTADRDASFRVLDAFVDAGGRSIDTADVYPAWVPGNSGGESETIIGEWFTSRGRRDDVVVATKVFSLATRPGLSPANVRAAADDSLRRLQTDRIDLYYAHRDDPDVSQEDYLAAFDALVREGKVREVGASNFTADRLRSAAAVAASAGLTPITVAQDRWSLVERDIEDDLVPTLRDLRIVEVPYTPLASGFLTGKYRPGGDAVESERAGRASSYLERPDAVALLGVLDDVAAAHGVSVPAVALAWVRQQDVVAAPTASARNPEQLEALVESFTLELSDEDVARLSSTTAG